MKEPDIFELAKSHAERLGPNMLQEMELERLRTSPEKQALIAEIVSLIFGGSHVVDR